MTQKQLTPAEKRKSLIWSVVVLTLLAGGWRGAIFVYAARDQQDVVSRLENVEVEYYVCALPGPSYVERGKVHDPVTFAVRGPGWSRSTLGEEFCRNWLDSVVAVNLANSTANDADIAGLRHFGSLKAVNLSYMKFTDAGLESLRTLKSVEELQIGSAELTDEGLAVVAELTSLRLLDIHWARITDGGVEKLCRLPRLTELRLSSDAITDEGAAMIAAMGQLESLLLSSTAITDDGVLKVRQLRNLKRLSLLLMPNLSPEVLKHLKDENPNLDLSYAPHVGA